jgi:hypothetical protein
MAMSAAVPTQAGVMRSGRRSAGAEPVTRPPVQPTQAGVMRLGRWPAGAEPVARPPVQPTQAGMMRLGRWPAGAEPVARPLALLGPWPSAQMAAMVMMIAGAEQWAAASRRGASTPGQRPTRGRPITPATQSSSRHNTFCCCR